MKTILSFAVGLGFLALSTGAFAQSLTMPAYSTSGSGNYNSSGYPMISYTSSTIAEGYLRGTADTYRGMGEYNYQTSLANINNQEAYSRSIDNAKKYMETYFEMRKLNREYVAAERGPKLTADQMKQFAKAGAPARLTAYQLNPVSGTINWPSMLQGDEFATYRDTLNKIFASRDAASTLGSDINRTAVATITDMAAELRYRMNEMTPAEYVTAKKFLDSLAYESQFAPGVAVADVNLP